MPRMTPSRTALLIAAALLAATPGHAQLRGKTVDACLDGRGGPELSARLCTFALHGLDDQASRATVLAARARHRLALGETDQALRDTDAALAANPASARALVLRGMVLQVLGRADDALAAFAEASHLNPFDADAASHSGALRLARGDAAGARADLDAALDADASHAEALALAGLVDMHDGDFSAAARRFEEGARQSPVRLPYAAVWLALSSGRADGDIPKTLAPYAWWWDDGGWPRPVVRTLMGELAPEALERQLQDNNALSSAQRAQGYFVLAQQAIAGGRHEKGLDWLRTAARIGGHLSPEAAIARAELARLGY